MARARRETGPMNRGFRHPALSFLFACGSQDPRSRRNDLCRLYCLARGHSSSAGENRRNPSRNRSSIATVTPAVGNGRKGNGCWIKMAGWHGMMGLMMSRMIGMPVGFGHDDFDEVYVKMLADHVRGNRRSISHAAVSSGRGLQRGRQQAGFRQPSMCRTTICFPVCAEHPEFLPAVSIHPRAARRAGRTLDPLPALGARALKLRCRIATA